MSRCQRSYELTQFVPQYKSFDHITLGDVIRNHTTIFAHATIFLLYERYIYIEKSLNMLFKESLTVFTMAGLLSNLWWLWHLTDISLISLARSLQIRYSDSAIFNKRWLKRENCILQWSDKNDTLVLECFRDSLEIIQSVGLRSASPLFWERDKSNTLYLKLMHPD